MRLAITRPQPHGKYLKCCGRMLYVVEILLLDRLLRYLSASRSYRELSPNPHFCELCLDPGISRVIRFDSSTHELHPVARTPNHSAVGAAAARRSGRPVAGAAATGAGAGAMLGLGPEAALTEGGGGALNASSAEIADRRRSMKVVTAPGTWRSAFSTSATSSFNAAP